MSEDRGPDDIRRSSSISWYSTYQSQLVGEPRTPWAQGPQDSDAMKTGEDQEELTSSVTIEGHQRFPSKDKTKDSSRDGGSDGLSEQDTRSLLRNGKFESEENDVSFETRSNRLVFRPFSMVEFEQRTDSQPGGGGGVGDDGAGEQRIQRSVSAFNWNDFYEEYKPPKRYQKPTGKKINTRLSRTFVTGAGNDKCTKCGDRLYEMEKVHVNHFSYHRSCFRCSQCQRLLNLGTFTSIDGQLFCKSHNLNAVTVMPGNPPSNGQRDISPATEPNPNGEEASTEVTLTSISNMKSIFEVPFKLNDGAAKKTAMHQNPEKNNADRQDSSLETRIHSEPPKVNREDDIEIIKETQSQMFHPLEDWRPNLDVVLAPLANGAHGTKTTSVVVAFQPGKDEDDDDDEDATECRVSDAFAKFRNVERQTAIRTSPKENGCVQQPKQEPAASYPTLQGDSVASLATPERTTVGHAGYHKGASGYFHQSSPTTGDHYPMPKAEGKGSNHYAGIGSPKKYAPEEIRLENGYPINSDVEIQITGIAKRLRHHWESKDVQDGRQHQRRPPTRGHGQGQGQGRGTGTNTAARRVYAPKTDVHINNGFHVSGREDDGPRAGTRRRQSAPERGIPGRVRERDDLGSAWVGPLDFAQNQLAKFKQLEAMTVRATRQPFPSKKTFRWGVKEVRPLHRPTSSYLNNDQNDSTPDIFMTTKTTTTTSPHRLLPTIQEHAWKNSPGCSAPPTHPRRDGHVHGQSTSSSAVTRSTSRDVFDGHDACLTSVRETLEQFKSLEDPSRPSPNPILALNQQKAAVATAPKPYHDVIHSAYNVQVAAKE